MIVKSPLVYLRSDVGISIEFGHIVSMDIEEHQDKAILYFLRTFLDIFGENFTIPIALFVYILRCWSLTTSNDFKDKEETYF